MLGKITLLVIALCFIGIVYTLGKLHGYMDRMAEEDKNG